MKMLFLLVSLSVTMEAWAQFRSQDVSEPYTFRQSILPGSHKTMIPGLLADPSRNYRPPSPLMTSMNYDWRLQNLFWAGNITTMSYNKGKFGTYFYWDVQGNLRGTRGFIDISGKNKRGLKLTFLWRSFFKTSFK